MRHQSLGRLTSYTVYARNCEEQTIGRERVQGQLRECYTVHSGLVREQAVELQVAPTRRRNGTPPHAAPRGGSGLDHAAGRLVLLTVSAQRKRGDSDRGFRPVASVGEAPAGIGNG